MLIKRQTTCNNYNRNNFHGYDRGFDRIKTNPKPPAYFRGF